MRTFPSRPYDRFLRVVRRASIGAAAGLVGLLGLASLGATATGCSGDASDGGESGTAADHSEVNVNWEKPVFADYGGALRRPDGHVDTTAMIAKLKALHVTTYAYLIWGWRYQATPFYDTDFSDLRDEFLPAAEAAGIKVWAYLPSPTEMEMYAPPPCRTDFPCWGAKLGELGAAHANFTGMVIDDMFSKPNIATMTPAYVLATRKAMRDNAPNMQLLPIAYFTNALHGLLTFDYATAMDGVLFVNLNRSIDDTNRYLPDELGQISRVLKSPLTALNLHAPPSESVAVGDQASLSQSIAIGDGPHVIRFAQGDDLFAKGPNTPAVDGADGTRMVQLLVNGNKVWEKDLNAAPVAGETPGFQRREVNIDDKVTPGKNATITFRVIATGAHAGIPDIDVNVFDVTGDNVTIGDAWKSNALGSPAWSATAAPRSYHERIVMMIYASTLAGGWTPDTQYIVQNVSWAHNAMAAGQLDGLITYQLDKVSTGGASTFAQLAGMYGQYQAGQ